jgi:hypothetical protein
MIRSFFHWMGEVVPPALVVVALLFYLVPLALYAWAQWWLGVPEASVGFLKMRDVVVVGTCALYGIVRAVAFHPLFDVDYRQWLQLTPWTSRKPLPLGPIHLVAQDAVVVAVAMFLVGESLMRFVLVPSAFLGGYLAVLCVSLMVTDVWKAGYVLAFGFGLAVRLAVEPAASLCVLAVLYPVAYLGLRQSLARFPWETPDGSRLLKTARQADRKETTSPPLGWPYDHLCFNLPDRVILRKHAILLSLLAGWYLYVWVSLIPELDDRKSGFALVLFAGSLISVVGRIGTYCANHWPPISLWGRIWTGRLIIPGYDQVLVAPLCVLLVDGALGAAFALGLPPEIIGPIGLSLVLLITLNMGPSLKKWRLTGHHRIGPGIAGGEKFLRL